MHLCLCPECAKVYRSKRSNQELLDDFIYLLRKANYKDEEPIFVSIDNIPIRFNQSHLFEVKILCEALYGDKDQLNKFIESLRE